VGTQMRVLDESTAGVEDARRARGRAEAGSGVFSAAGGKGRSDAPGCAAERAPRGCGSLFDVVSPHQSHRLHASKVFLPVTTNLRGT
jgi:hypothetical protein